jgi:hypothetical protein
MLKNVFYNGGVARLRELVSHVFTFTRRHSGYVFPEDCAIKDKKIQKSEKQTDRDRKSRLAMGLFH